LDQTLLQPTVGAVQQEPAFDVIVVGDHAVGKSAFIK